MKIPPRRLEAEGRKGSRIALDDATHIWVSPETGRVRSLGPPCYPHSSLRPGRMLLSIFHIKRDTTRKDGSGGSP